MTAKRKITRDDLLAMGEFGAIRKQRRAEMSAIKRQRRGEGGPAATLYFESYDTMWWQIHEMLWIEKGGEAQIDGELSAYNPLIPKGTELVATLMFEIDDPNRRAMFLAGLGGVEETVTMSFNGETVTAVPEDDVDRTTGNGKASAIQFLHFPFTVGQIAKLRPGSLIDSRIRIDAPEIDPSEPAFVTSDLDPTPAEILSAFQDPADDVRLDLGDSDTTRVWLLAARAHGLGNDQGAPAAEKTLVDPALGCLPIAHLTPGPVFGDHFYWKVLAMIDPLDRVLHTGASTHVDLGYAHVHEPRQRQPGGAGLRPGDRNGCGAGSEDEEKVNQ